MSGRKYTSYFHIVHGLKKNVGHAVKGNKASLGSKWESLM